MQGRHGRHEYGCPSGVPSILQRSKADADVDTAAHLEGLLEDKYQVRQLEGYTKCEVASSKCVG